MKTTNLGMPNVYENLIKKTVEGYWNKTKTLEDITNAENKVSEYNLSAQSKLDLTPIFDIDTYDRLLRTGIIFGIAPKRFGTPEQINENLELYLSIPRGNDKLAASPMVKWFNTNYHVVQPEIEHEPYLISNPKLPEFKNENTKLALIGPWTLLSFSINKTNYKKEELFEKLSKEYIKLINNSQFQTIQLEEPSFLVHGIPKEYEKFIKNVNKNVHLHTYFGNANDIAEKLFNLPVEGIGLDFIEGKRNTELLKIFPKDKKLIAGIISGKHHWQASTKTKKLLEEIKKYIKDKNLYISPSCPLIHVPLEEAELSFANKKIDELSEIKKQTIKYKETKYKKTELPKERFERTRKTLWVSDIPYPTTTIGSFPQTTEIRNTRNKLKNGEISVQEYEEFIKKQIKECIEFQEKIGLDVLVHGEFERPDMVQYFAENLEGFTTIKGTIQSYGTRHTRPPVITGEIKRNKQITVEWIKYAQSLTKKPVKAILTGPVTIVQWSYPREEVPKETQFYECAKAIAEEIDDLVKAGIKHIQIDEPALREALPINKEEQENYLFHATNAFRLCYANAPDDVIIHSHMCFSEFKDILPALNELGVDVLSIEDSKAQGKTSEYINKEGFNGSIGLGVYDVHSPRIPNVEEIIKIPSLLNIDPRKIWINPDCGLKTRGKEAYKQLEIMLEATHILRSMRK